MHLTQATIRNNGLNVRFHPKYYPPDVRVTTPESNKVKFTKSVSPTKTVYNFERDPRSPPPLVFAPKRNEQQKSGAADRVDKGADLNYNSLPSRIPTRIKSHGADSRLSASNRGDAVNFLIYSVSRRFVPPSFGGPLPLMSPRPSAPPTPRASSPAAPSSRRSSTSGDSTAAATTRRGAAGAAGPSTDRRYRSDKSSPPWGARRQQAHANPTTKYKVLSLTFLGALLNSILLRCSRDFSLSSSPGAAAGDEERRKRRGPGLPSPPPPQPPATSCPSSTSASLPRSFTSAAAATAGIEQRQRRLSATAAADTTSSGVSGAQARIS